MENGQIHEVTWRPGFLARQRRRSKMFGGVALTLLGVITVKALTGCATVEPVAEGNVIKIATQSPLSGEQAVLGEALKLGAQLAIENLKRPIEDAGFTVKLVPFDDQARPDVGVANARKIVADPNILLVIGHLNSAVALPASDLYKDVQLAMISPANTNPLVTDRRYPNVYRVIGRDDAQGTVAAIFAQSDLRADSAYVLHDRTLYGQGVAESFQTKAQSLGMRVVGFEGTREKADFTSVIRDIQAKNPDVVYFGGVYDQAGVFFKHVRAAGVRAGFLGPDGMDSSDLARIGGESVVGLHYTTVTGPPNIIYPQSKEFVAGFRSKFGKRPEPFAAEAYDATVVGLKGIESAIRQTGGRRPTREEISIAIRHLGQLQGLTGPITFDEKGDRITAPYFVIRVDSSNPTRWGENRFVKTITASPPARR